MKFLGEGIYKLGKLLFPSGALEIFTPITSASSIKSKKELDNLRKAMNSSMNDITTIHFFSSYTMGEDIKKCAVDSYDRHNHQKNIY